MTTKLEELVGISQCYCKRTKQKHGTLSISQNWPTGGICFSLSQMERRRPVARSRVGSAIFRFNIFKSNAKLERFSIECRKTKTKVITTGNQNKGKYHKEPIRTQSKYM